LRDIGHGDAEHRKRRCRGGFVWACREDRCDRCGESEGPGGGVTMGLFDGGGKTLQKNLNDIMASRGMVPLHELVRRIHEGDSSKWHEAATKANSVVEAHQDASERSMKMLQVLESSWTGEGADAAAEKIRAGAKATEMAAAVYAANARRYTDSAY